MYIYCICYVYIVTQLYIYNTYDTYPSMYIYIYIYVYILYIIFICIYILYICIYIIYIYILSILYIIYMQNFFVGFEHVFSCRWISQIRQICLKSTRKCKINCVASAINVEQIWLIRIVILFLTLKLSTYYLKKGQLDNICDIFCLFN